jgi:hypothetical protein
MTDAQGRVIQRKQNPAKCAPVIPSYATPGGVRIYRDDSVPGGLRTYHDDPPAYDDPSKFGSG